MSLPLHLQMEIDIHAQMHSRDIAEAFAKLRAKLPPDPAQSMARLQEALMNAALTPLSLDQMEALRPANPFLPPSMQDLWPQPAFGNAAWPSSALRGIFGQFP